MWLWCCSLLVCLSNSNFIWIFKTRKKTAKLIEMEEVDMLEKVPRRAEPSKSKKSKLQRTSDHITTASLNASFAPNSSIAEENDSLSPFVITNVFTMSANSDPQMLSSLGFSIEGTPTAPRSKKVKPKKSSGHSNDEFAGAFSGFSHSSANVELSRKAGASYDSEPFLPEPGVIINAVTVNYLSLLIISIGIYYMQSFLTQQLSNRLILNFYSATWSIFPANIVSNVILADLDTKTFFSLLIMFFVMATAVMSRMCAEWGLSFYNWTILLKKLCSEEQNFPASMFWWCQNVWNCDCHLWFSLVKVVNIFCPPAKEITKEKVQHRTSVYHQTGEHRGAFNCRKCSSVFIYRQRNFNSTCRFLSRGVPFQSFREGRGGDQRCYRWTAVC